MTTYPNLFIPGFPKSGTSSLYHYLNQHDDVDGVKRKEPHTFTFAHRFRTIDEGLAGQFDEENDYRYRLDASTTYMISPEASRRIHETVPDAKFILLARDPIERVFSHYNWLWCEGSIQHDFEREIREWASRPFDPKTRFGYNYKYYTQFSRYGEQVERYLDIFDRDQMLILTTEDLKADPAAVLRQCTDFLDLPAHDAVNTRRRNVTRSKDVTSYPRAVTWMQNALPDVITRPLESETVQSWFTTTYEPKSFGEAEERLVFSLIEDDMRTQVELGIFSDQWTTTAQYL